MGRQSRGVGENLVGLDPAAAGWVAVRVSLARFMLVAVASWKGFGQPFRTVRPTQPASRSDRWSCHIP